MSKTQNTESKLDAELETSNLLGILISWSISEVKVSYKALNDLFQSQDLDFKYFPPPIQNSAVFRKAADLVMRKGEAKGYSCRPILSDDEKIVLGIVSETIDTKSVDLKLRCESKIEFQKETHSVVVSGVPERKAYEIANSIKREYTALQDCYISVDIQRMMKRSVDRIEGFPMRSGGGMYFIPPQHVNDVYRLRSVVESLGECELNIVLVQNFETNIRSVGRNALSHLSSDLDKLKAELEKFKTASPHKGTLGRRLKSLATFKEKVQMYANLLNLELSGLVSDIDVCKEVLEDMHEQHTGPKRPVKPKVATELEVSKPKRRKRKTLAAKVIEEVPRKRRRRKRKT